MTTTAILPLRSLCDGKRRLASVLSVAERTSLVQTMFARAYAAVSSAALDRLIVVSPDPALLTWVARYEVEPVLQPDNGLNAGLEHARQMVLADQSVSTLLVLLPDLPHVTMAEIDEVLRLTAPRTVVLVPNRHGCGTNALLHDVPAAYGAEQPTLPPFLFGTDSLAQHRAAARALGWQVRQHQLRTMALDIDTAEDLDLAALPDYHTN